MKIGSEAEMLQLGQKISEKLQLPAIIELIGDVGVGKTTFTRGLAQGLGISVPVTSPSFMISKRYAFPLNSKCCKKHNISQCSSACGELVHYDFYRLNDPGIMQDELSESLRDPNSVIIIEWGGDVANLLPEQHLRLEIKLNPDGSREVSANQPNFLEDLS